MLPPQGALVLRLAPTRPFLAKPTPKELQNLSIGRHTAGSRPFVARLRAAVLPGHYATRSPA